jgi:hypothetical protein
MGWCSGCARRASPESSTNASRFTSSLIALTTPGEVNPLAPIESSCPCQLSLGLPDLPVSASLSQSLPDEIGHQVLGLLARLIVKGALVDPDGVVTEASDA